MNCEMKTQSKEIQWSIFGDLTKSLSRYLEYLNMNEKLVLFFFAWMNPTNFVSGSLCLGL